jgi:hypothetical protein
MNVKCRIRNKYKIIYLLNILKLTLRLLLLIRNQLKKISERYIPVDFSSETNVDFSSETNIELSSEINVVD